MTVMDSQGIEAAVDYATIASEHEFEDDLEALCTNQRAENRYLAAEWGYVYGNPLFTPPVISTVDAQAAIAELDDRPIRRRAQRLALVTVNLNEKVVIVTGASRGIGRQLAFELARRGAKVVVAARTVEPRRRLPGSIGETLQAIEASGGTAVAVQVDVTRVEDLERLVATTIETFGQLDVLVNNAADTQGSSAAIEEYPRESWLHQFDANVHAPFVLMGLAVPHLRARGGGVIVNVTSGAADLVAVTRGAGAASADDPIHLGTLLGYATTKAALNRLTNALAPDLMAQNIAVVCVDPGFTRTELVDLLQERGFVDAESAATMDVPVQTILNVITADDPLAFTGQVVRAQPAGDGPNPPDRRP